jgi:hypothetical protein
VSVGDGRLFDSDRDKRRRLLSPQQLYQDCVAREKEIRNHPPNAEDVMAHQFFDRRIFLELHGYRRVLIGKTRHHNGVSINESTLSSTEWRYRTLVRLLKEHPEMYERLLILANWLKHEGICEPDEFLPTEVRSNLLKRITKKELKLSSADLLNRSLIRNWVMYFERIRSELAKRTVLTRKKEEVCKLGFDPNAVSFVAADKSTVISAICKWLDGRLGLDARNLRNSYSKLQGKPSSKLRA